MNNLMNNETETAETLVNEIDSAIALSEEVLATSRDTNDILTASYQVRPVFMTHYVNLRNDTTGIADLITEILTDNGAIFPLGTENTELRSLVVATAMLHDEILAEVEARFSAGTSRYNTNTVRPYIGSFMRHDRVNKEGQIIAKATVASFPLTNKEDSARECNRPRSKYYLIKA